MTMKFARSSLFAAAASLGALASPAAYATTMIWTLVGTGANGSLGSNSFTDATITITASDDTSEITTPFGAQFVYAYPHGLPIPVTIAITGLSPVTDTIDPYVINAYSNYLGIGDGSNGDFFDIPISSTYDLSTSFGPVTTAFDADPETDTFTSGGEFIVNYVANASFTSAVGAAPEPASLALLGVGVIAIATVRRKRS